MTRWTTTFILAVAGTAGMATAAPFTLEDGNSSMAGNPVSVPLNAWVVDGVDHLFAYTYFLRIQGDTQERQLTTFPLLSQQGTDTNPFVDPRVDTLNTVYGAGPLQISTFFQLRGGAPGSGSSGYGELVDIVNTSTQPVTFSFFTYADFDVNGTSGGDTVQILGSNFNTVNQSEGFTVTQSVVTPGPSRWQVGSWPTLASALGDGDIDDLNNTAGPLGPGDMTWAMQWDVVLAPGSTFQISKVNTIVPTPGAVALVGVAALAGARRRRR